MTSVLDQLQTHARLQPDAIALEGMKTRLSYAQLHARMSDLAYRLGEAGVRRVGLIGDNSPAWIVADLALWQAGLLNVPVPPFFSERQIAHLIESAGLDALIGAPALLETLAPGQTIESLDQDLGLARLPEPRSLPPIDPAIRKVTFTSGSSGTPKGVCLTTANLDNTVDGLNQALSDVTLDDHLCVLPLATLLENVAGVYLPLSRGARVSVLPLGELGLGGSSGLDPARFLDTLKRLQPHSLIFIPQLLKALVQAAEAGQTLPDSLRFVAVGGGKVAPSLLEAAHRHGLPVYEGYGLSECSSVVALNTPGANRPGKVGRPLPHLEVRVADNGEILVRGNTMAGYLGEPPLGEDWLHTGDLGEFDSDGYLSINGRLKNYFITAFGRNVHPEWLESEFQAHPAIAQIAVFGDDLPQPVAIIVPNAGYRRSDIEDAIDSINATLPDYARIGRLLLAPMPFSVANGLATANGRIVRRAVEDHYQAWIYPEADIHSTLNALREEQPS
ncbi:AMP-binding protein [Marinobacteraceae bacterium S3BR75-40.1]